MVYVGPPRSHTPTITVMCYHGPHLAEERLDRTDELSSLLPREGVMWVHVDGVWQTGLVEEVGRALDIHPLVLEDIVHTSQRSRVVDMGTHLFVPLRLVRPHPSPGKLETQQVSLVVGATFLASFCETPQDPFDLVRQRIRSGRARIRSMGPDYLAYALMDAVVDSYFPLLETTGEEIEAIQDSLVASPTTRTLEALLALKSTLATLKRSTWPLRDVLSTLTKIDNPLVSGSCLPYLRDLHDHVMRVTEAIDSQREQIAGLMDIYLNSVNNKMSEVMKVLTIIATLFMPLSFIAGIYGMNFPNMPELRWAWGYPAVLGTMALIVVGMTFYFKRRGWL